MRATAQRATLATAVVSAGVTAAITFVPDLHFAYRSHTAQAVLETTAGLLSLLAAYLVLERFRRRRGEAVGGSLAVASRPGTGTTVEVVVPR